MIEIILLLAIIGTIIISYLFYKSNEGMKSIYISKYASLIDFLATISGAGILISSFLLYKLGINYLLLAILFIGGNLQMSMHIAKYMVRKRYLEAS
tara:strand:+ start:60 stop:347 length:288 start_codon:yes stop_codon:yes gene_type:complete